MQDPWYPPFPYHVSALILMPWLVQVDIVSSTQVLPVCNRGKRVKPSGLNRMPGCFTSPPPPPPSSPLPPGQAYQCTDIGQYHHSRMGCPGSLVVIAMRMSSQSLQSKSVAWNQCPFSADQANTDAHSSAHPQPPLREGNSAVQPGFWTTPLPHKHHCSAPAAA